METRKKILIVDDDIDVITVIVTILKRGGYDVYSAMDKKEGLEKLSSLRPDLAILDVMMATQYEGFEIAQEMLSNPEFTDIPFLIHSSINIIETSNPNVQEMARELRRIPELKTTQVLLIKNIIDGSAGIDYMAEDGNSHWFSVRGFIKKPVDTQKILPEISKHIR